VPRPSSPRTQLSTPLARLYLLARDADSQLVNVPPMSNHRETFAHVVALDAGPNRATPGAP